MTVDAMSTSGKLEALRARLADIDGTATAEAVEMVRTALDELRVLHQELTRQDGELANLQLAVAREAARYDALVELVPVACVTTDRHAVIIEANGAAAALLGVERRFVIGKPLPLYVDESQRRELRSVAARLTNTGDAAVDSLRVRMRRRNGVAFDAAVDARASDRGVQWVLQDVTEERHAEQRLWELNRELETRVAEHAGDLATVLEQLPVGVLIVEADTLLLRRANRRAHEILGDAIAAGSPVSFERFGRLSADGRPLERDAWPVTRALAGERVEREIVVVVFPDGRRLTLEINAVAARGSDGRVTGAVLTFDDVTEREAHERAQRDFVSNAAHELRTPLTAIATTVEVLQSGAKEIPEERDLFLAHLERECGRLARLGSALLALSRAQAQQEAPAEEVLPLREVLEHVAAGLNVAEGVEVTVACAREVGALANRDLVEQAVWNVAANAARYTHRGEITLSAALDGDAVIEVRDTGPGIPTDAQSRLFERFYRAGARDSEGFGLGLSIAKQAVEAVGGTLTVESDDGAGTTARIILRPARLL